MCHSAHGFKYWSEIIRLILCQITRAFVVLVCIKSWPCVILSACSILSEEYDRALQRVRSSVDVPGERAVQLLQCGC